MNNQKGVTLVELLAVVALSGVIVSVLMQFFFVNTQSMNYQQVQTQLQRETTQLFTQLNKVSYGASQYQFSDAEQQLTLCYDAQPKQVVQLSAGNFLIGDQVVSQAVTQWQITPLAANVLEVALTLQAPNGRNVVTYQETTTLRMRNYKEAGTCGNE